MTKTKLLLITFFILFFIIPFSASAFEVKTDNSVFVAKDETVAGTLYAAGNTVTVDGTVTGDVICGAQTVNINGRVEGDVICGAQTININGYVGGSIRVAGNSININGTVARGVQALGASIVLGTEASVGSDMFIAGAAGDIRGNIAGDLHGVAETVIIAGQIDKDVKLRLSNRIKSEARGVKFREPDPLIITDEAVIGGNVYYTSGIKGKISETAVIGGETGHSSPKKTSKKNFAVLSGWKKLISIFSALIIGLVLISLWRKQIKQLTDKMLNDAGVSIGWGVVVMFITPILALLLIITIIGIPLAMIVICLWLIALYISKILVGILIGRSLVEKFWKSKKDSLIWAMVVGVVVSWLIFSIPIIGWLLCLVAMWWGLGGMWLYFKKAQQN